MIYDSLDQLSRYTGLSRSLDAAVKAITSADLFALPAGRHELVPDMVYAVVSQIETKPLAEAVLEAHRDYLDIQIDLEGSEQIGVSSLEDPRLTVTQAYDKRNDCQLLSGPLTVSCPMGPGRFLILFPHDAHATGLADGVPGTVKKAVIKVKLENS